MKQHEQKSRAQLEDEQMNQVTGGAGLEPAPSRGKKGIPGPEEFGFQNGTAQGGNPSAPGDESSAEQRHDPGVLPHKKGGNRMVVI